MSEDDVKIGGVAHVLKFLVFGIIYMALLFAVISSSHNHQLIDHHAMNSFSDGMGRFFKNHNPQAALGLIVATIVLFSIITGLLINDLTKKLSIITIFILVVMTLIDIATIQFVLSDNGII
jgi:hypothetical protein